MFLRNEFLIASRYLFSKQKERFISVNTYFSLIGIMIGVAALIVVMSIMNGFRVELTNKIIGLNSDVVISRFNQKPIVNYSEIKSIIEKHNQVTKTIPIIDAQALLNFGGQSSGVMVKGILEEDLKKIEVVKKNIKKGSIDGFSGSQILIGSSLANSLGVKAGEKLMLIVPEFNSTVFGFIPKMKELTIAGIYSTGLTEYDSTLVYIPLDVGQKIYDLKNAVNRIEIFANNHEIAPDLAYEISESLAADYMASNWQQTNAALFNALQTERVVMFVILGLIIIVATFNIVSSLVMLVLDKTKEIAILKTIGLSNNSILIIFLICGFFIGLIGTLIGLLLGVLIALNISSIKDFLSNITGTDLFNPVVYYLDTLPSIVRLEDIFYITSLSLIASIIATIYPSIKAARFRPAQAIREA